MTDKPKEEQQAKRVGRPSDFTPEIANEICERLINGESLRRICRDDGMPNASTVCRWLGQNEEFRKQYAHAREVQADTYADEIVDIADGDVSEDADAAVAAQLAARDRLRVDARKWVASKLAPKKYGEKTTTEHTGEGGGPIQTETRVQVYVPDNGR